MMTFGVPLIITGALGLTSIVMTSDWLSTILLTLVDGEEVEEAEVTMVLAGGEAYTQQDRFTGRGSTGAFSEEGMEGRERERVRGLCARDGSGGGTSMGAREAGPQLPFIPSRVPSPCMARVTGQSLC